MSSYKQQRETVKDILRTRDTDMLVEALASFIAIQLKVERHPIVDIFGIYEDECDAHPIPLMVVGSRSDPRLTFEQESRRLAVLLRDNRPKARVIIASMALCEAAARAQRSRDDLRQIMEDVYIRVPVPRKRRRKWIRPPR